MSHSPGLIYVIDRVRKPKGILKLANPNLKRRALIEGNPALIVVDIQASTFIDSSAIRSIDNMPGYKERMLSSRALIDCARTHHVPIIFIQEAHRPDLVDFGRELDGNEDIHCLEGKPGTEIAVKEMDYRPTDYLIKKRRYSAFFGTDLEILLKGLAADTLLFCGGLTDVCVHYSFVDGHQSDYFCRVVEDCVAGSSLEAHEASLRAMEYLQAGARRSLSETLSALESHKNSSSQ